MPYHIIWGERVVRSIANLTRSDAQEFLDIAAQFKIETTIQPMPLSHANKALQRLRDGEVNGALVLEPGP